MKNAEIIALAKATSERAVKAASEELEPGHYDVDMLVRVLGSFDKGKDTESKGTVSIQWQVLAALLASKVNAGTLAAVLDEYQAAQKDESNLEALKASVKESVEGRFAALKEAQAPIKRTGTVRANLVAETVGDAKVVRSAK